MDVLFARPVGADVSLWRPPALEGRDGGYLDRLEQELGWSRRGEHLALALDAGLPTTVPVAGEGHDLDDYLFPVVERLGHVRFDAAFATKRHAHRSLIRVGPAAPPADALPAPQVRVRTTASATSIDWKEQVHDACRAATREPAPAGPVAVALRFTVSRRRNWTALWKPALQALGPILGVPDPAMPYRASAGRITSLALHRRWDDLVAHRVEVEVWWRPAA